MEKNQVWSWPSISEGLSRSMRKILPVAKASIRTLFATWPATKSDAILNCNWTRSTLKIGRVVSTVVCESCGATYEERESSAMLRYLFGSLSPLLLLRCGICYFDRGAWLLMQAMGLRHRNAEDKPSAPQCCTRLTWVAYSNLPMSLSRQHDFRHS